MNNSNSKVDEDDYKFINQLINKPIISEKLVSYYIIKHYNHNITYEYSPYDFLENLKKCFKYYLELIDAINDVESIVCELNKAENKLFLVMLKRLSNNVTNDKNNLTNICRNFCNLCTQIKSNSNILDKVQKTIKKNNEEIVTRYKLKELLNFKTYSDISKYIINKFNGSCNNDCTDCAKDIKKCCIFYTQLMISINNIIDLLSDSQKEKTVKDYLEKIIEKINNDYNYLKKIEENLMSLYRFIQY